MVFVKRIGMLMLLPIIALLFGAYSTSNEAKDIRKNSIYSTLPDNEKGLVEQIMYKADSSDKKEYYYSKLKLLLVTPTNPKKITKILNNRSVKKSIQQNKIKIQKIEKSNIDINTYINKEEDYEKNFHGKWHRYRPNKDSAYFYVATEDYMNILVNIRVHLVGDAVAIKNTISLEDAVEKHLSIPGFSVNLVFVKNTYEDAFDVKIDMENWATSHNWAGGSNVIAHELMHLMGLSDEYNRIESHAANSNVNRYNRLYWFLKQMDDTSPPDSMFGIMCNHNNRPLQRHVCAAVGLGSECVNARKQINSVVK